MKTVCIFFIIFGYYLIAPISFFVNVESPIFSMSLRIVFYFLFLWTFRYSFRTLNVLSLYLLMFLIFLNLLLMHNLFIAEYPTNDDPMSFYLYHSLVVIPTCLLISFVNVEELDSESFINTGCIFFLISAVLNVLCGVLTIRNDPTLLLTGRFQHDYLNPISMGYMFATAIVFWGLKVKYSKKINIGSVLVIFLLLLGLILSNSRSALIGVGIVFFYINFREVIKFQEIRLFISSSILVVALITVLIVYMDVNPFERLLSITSKSEESVTSRIAIWSDTLKYLADNPLYPMRLVTEYGGFPHNIFIELLSGFGIIIGMICILFLLLPFFKLYKGKLINILVLTYILYLMRATTSGGLYQLNEMFALLILIMSNFKIWGINEVNCRDRSGA